MVWRLRKDPNWPVGKPRLPKPPSLPKLPKLPELPKLPRPPKPPEVLGYKWYWSEPSRRSRKR
jgi:hypothetical protein